MWNDNKSINEFKGSEIQWGRLLLFSWKCLAGEMLLHIFPRRLFNSNAKMQHSKMSTKFWEKPYEITFEIFSVSSPRGSLPACPVQGVQGPQCPSSAGKWFLSVAPPRENISVGIKELLCFIRLKSSWAVVHNGEQKKFKEPDKLFMVASLRPPHLLATTAAASSDVFCLILTRRWCKSSLMESYVLLCPLNQQRVDELCEFGFGKAPETWWG